MAIKAINIILVPVAAQPHRKPKFGRGGKKRRNRRARRGAK